MKQISNFSLVGYIAGALFSLLSAIRYFLIYYDLDRALVYILIGVLIMAVSFLYDKVKKLSYEVDSMGEYLQEKR